MSAALGPTAGSPYIASDLKRASAAVGTGKNGGRRHHPSGAKRASAAIAAGHSRGRSATAHTDITATFITGLTASEAATAAR